MAVEVKGVLDFCVHVLGFSTAASERSPQYTIHYQNDIYYSRLNHYLMQCDDQICVTLIHTIVAPKPTNDNNEHIEL